MKKFTLEDLQKGKQWNDSFGNEDEALLHYLNQRVSDFLKTGIEVYGLNLGGSKGWHFAEWHHAEADTHKALILNFEKLKKRGEK